MIVSITNNILTDLETKFTGQSPEINVVGDFPTTNPSFPIVVVEEGSISSDLDTFDSGGYNTVSYTVTIEIFTSGTGRKTASAKIRKQIQELLAGEYTLRLIQANSIPNFGDTTVHRYRMTYVGRLDENKRIYRG